MRSGFNKGCFEEVRRLVRVAKAGGAAFVLASSRAAPAGPGAAGDRPVSWQDVETCRSRIRVDYPAVLREAETKQSAKFRTPGTLKPFDTWRLDAGNLRRELAQDIFAFPADPGPLDPRTVGRKEHEHFVLEKVIFCAEPGSLVTANLYLPKVIRGRAPALVIASGTQISKVEELNQAAGQIYAQGGAVVLVPDTLGEGDRRGSGSHTAWVDACREAGREFMGKAVFDLIRCADYLCTRPEVDPRRIGITGHSLGGIFAGYAAALDGRFAVVAPVSTGLAAPAAALANGMGCHRAWRLGQVADSVDVLALIAPRPLCMIQGTRDHVPIAEVRKTVALLREYYEKGCRQPDRFEFTELANVGHAPHFLRKICVEWISRQLELPDFTAEKLADLQDRPRHPDWTGWLQHVPCLDVPLEMAPYKVTYTFGAYGCSAEELDCIPAADVTDPEYTLKGWLETVTRDLPPEIPPPRSKDEWLRTRSMLIQKIADLLGLVSPQAERIRPAGSVTDPAGRTVRILEHEPTRLHSALWAPAGEAPGPPVIYLHRSRTYAGGVGETSFEEWIGAGRCVVCLDAVSSDMTQDRDVFLGTSTTAANVQHVLDVTAWLLQHACGPDDTVEIVGEVDDVALWATAVCDRLAPITLAGRALTERWKSIPSDWRGTERYEGAVPRRLTVIGRGGLMAMLAPREVVLKTDETQTDFTLHDAVEAVLGMEQSPTAATGMHDDPP